MNSRSRRLGHKAALGRNPGDARVSRQEGRRNQQESRIPAYTPLMVLKGCWGIQGLVEKTRSSFH